MCFHTKSPMCCRVGIWPFSPIFLLKLSLHLCLHNNWDGAWWRDDDDIRWECFESLSIASPNVVSLLTTARAMTLGWPNCFFNDFSAVAYIMPFDPRPEIGLWASPFTCIRNWIIRVQEPMSSSMQVHYGVFLSRRFHRNLLWMRLPWECHNQSQDTNWRHCVTDPELPFFHKRKGVLKIDQSVKMPGHWLSMGVASSCSSAPADD